MGQTMGHAGVAVSGKQHTNLQKYNFITEKSGTVVFKSDDFAK